MTATTMKESMTAASTTADMHVSTILSTEIRDKPEPKSKRECYQCPKGDEQNKNEMLSWTVSTISRITTERKANQALVY